MAAYKDFLALWKGADSDVPIYKQAKGGVREAGLAIHPDWTLTLCAQIGFDIGFWSIIKDQAAVPEPI